MKKTLHYIALIAFVFAAAVPAYSQARPRRNNQAARQRAAAAAARAKADAEAQKKTQDNYNALHPYLPNLTLGELKGISAADLRNLYQKSFEAQGMKMGEAKEKAASMKF